MVPRRAKLRHNQHPHLWTIQICQLGGCACLWKQTDTGDKRANWNHKPSAYMVPVQSLKIDGLTHACDHLCWICLHKWAEIALHTAIIQSDSTVAATADEAGRNQLLVWGHETPVSSSFLLHHFFFPSQPSLACCYTAQPSFSQGARAAAESLPELTEPSVLMEARMQGSEPADFCWILSLVSSLSCCDVTGGKR